LIFLKVFLNKNANKYVLKTIYTHEKKLVIVLIIFTRMKNIQIHTRQYGQDKIKF